MAIQVRIKAAHIVDEGYQVTLITTNDDYEGEEEQFNRIFPDALSIVDAKAQVDAAVQKHWVARGVTEWTVA